MRFACEKQTLLSALAIVQRAMASKSTTNVLEGTYIQTQPDGLLLKCMDMSMQIESIIQASIAQEGSIILPGRIFMDIVRHLPEGTIDFDEIQPGTMQIVCGRSRTTLQGIASEEFPTLPPLDMPIPIEIPQKILRDMIRKTLFAAAMDETRPVLTGALLEGGGNSLTMVALDGYRLALTNETLEQDVPEFQVIIPAKSLNELHKILGDLEDPVTLNKAAGYVCFEIGAHKVTTRLLEGEFVNYKQIIPQEQDTSAIVDCQALLQSMERASLLAREGHTNLVRFFLSEDGLQITSQSEVGDTLEKVEIDFSGKDLEIAFNAVYFIDALKVLDQATIRMDFQTSLNPCVVKPVQGDAFTYLILPVRVH